MNQKDSIFFVKRQVTDVAFKMIHELFQRKQKWDEFEKGVKRWAVVGAFFIVLTMLSIAIHAFGRELSILRTITNQSTFFFLALGAALSFFQLRFFHKKREKAEAEYEELRHEVIDRTVELWDSTELWEERHETFQQLNERFGINLYFK